MESQPLHPIYEEGQQNQKQSTQQSLLVIVLIKQ
jgi:hypothetical protein